MIEIPNTSFDYFGLGFFSPKIDKSRLNEASMLASANGWHVFTGILLSCERGDFSALERLIPLMKSNENYLLWQAACNLAGHAGGWTFVSRLIQAFQTKTNDPGVIFFMAIAMGSACSLNAVGPLKKLHSMATDEKDRFQIEHELSCILEENDGTVQIGADVEEIVVETNDELRVDTIIHREEYFRVVDEYHNNVIRRISSPDTPVFEGEAYDIIGIAQRLRARLIEAPDSGERLHRERLNFESCTGVDCTGFYNESRRLVPLAAIAIIDEFLDRDDLGKFVPGQRYFFGHPIQH